MSQSALHVVILAAGQGTRMRSPLPKGLHLLAGKPLLEHVITTAQTLAGTIHVIYGHGGELLKAKFTHLPVHWIEQTEQLGTGHAVLQAMPFVTGSDRVLILVGDVPLITAATLADLLAVTPHNSVGLITMAMSNPTGLGRILRDTQNKVIGIIEEKDANSVQRQITEVNTGIVLAPAEFLQQELPKLNNNNKQGEYYLTDIIALAAEQGVAIATTAAQAPEEVQGVNDLTQLAQLERYYQRQVAEKLMLHGVTLRDPNRFDLRGTLQAAPGSSIDVNVVLEGTIVLGANTQIGANCILKNVTLGDRVEIKANSVLEDVIVGDDCSIGPFARLRPGTHLAAHVHVGNFVEIKNAQLGQGSKVNHLSYIGDATVGQAVNIGAGTITCNYDGVNKHRTVIEDGAFIGSDTQLVAPVTIGKDATIGAGSTITKDAPAQALTLSRAKQQSIPDWPRPKKTD